MAPKAGTSQGSNRRNSRKANMIIDSEDEEYQSASPAQQGTASDDIEVDIQTLVDDVEQDASPRRTRLKRSGSSSTSTKKKVKLVVAEQDYGDDMLVDDDQVMEDEDTDDNFIEDDVDDEPRKAGKSRAGRGGKSSRGKGRGGAKQTRGSKPKEPEKEIMVRDERKLPAGKAPPATAVTGQKRSAVDGSTPTSNRDHTPASSEPPPPVKKQKLPPIKKNKQAGAPTTLTVTAESKPARDAATISAGGPVARTINHADLDLNDSATYMSLFSSAGTGPRSAAVQKEEGRKKELGRMKDEARSHRLAEVRQSFNIEGQKEKILAYEQTMRIHFHPDTIAAKLSDQYMNDRLRNARNRPVHGTEGPPPRQVDAHPTSHASGPTP